MANIVVAAFYHFVRLPDLWSLREALLDCCQQRNLRGTILLAPEGINGTIAGLRDEVDAVLAFIRADPHFAGIKHKESFASELPFHRMKVRLKKEIVTMGVPDTDPENLVGTYLDAIHFNEMINDPDVLIVDTRNDYEVAIGTFRNATSPGTTTFREFPDYVQQQLADKKDQKIAMFCTGGIRCEKATSFLKANGFEQVFHLQGGILKYLETVPEEENLWQGDCFVFDDRVSVNKNLEKGDYDMCHACRHPISTLDKKSEHYVSGVSCPWCIDKYTTQQRQGFAEREKQVRIAQARGQQHIGLPLPDSDTDDEHD